jgi:hypothetical protein
VKSLVKMPNIPFLLFFNLFLPIRQTPVLPARSLI